MSSPTEDDQDGRKDIYARLRGKSGKPKDPQLASLKENRRAASLSDFGKRSASAPFRLNNGSNTRENGLPKTALPTLSLDVGDASGQLGEDDGIKGFMTTEGSPKSSGTKTSSYMQPTRSSIYHQRSQKFESSPLACVVKEDQSPSTRALEQELSELQAQNRASEAQFKQHIERVEAAWAKERQALQKENIEGKEEILSLKRRNAELKQSIAKTSYSTDQLPDEFLRDEMENLNWEMQNWIMNGFRKAQLSLTNLSSGHRAIVERAIPESTTLQHHKIASLQAIIAWCLKRIFDEKLFYGLPRESAFRHLLEANEAFSDSTMQFNYWRVATVKFLLSKKFQTIDEHTSKLVYETTELIVQILLEITGISLPTIQRDALKRLINRAVDISRLFRSQLAVFEFEFVDLRMKQKILFNRKTMEDISGNESTALEEPILIATSPTIRKYGDEKGDNLQLENILLRAKVIRGTTAVEEAKSGP